MTEQLDLRDDQCRRCNAWAHLPTRSVADDDTAEGPVASALNHRPEHPDGQHGECRRHAPTIGHDGEATFPRSSALDWCAEYLPVQLVADDLEQRPGDKQLYISIAVVELLIVASPDDQWRLILSLIRYAGLRLSEVLALRWDDISWDNGKMTVRSSKSPGSERVVPIILELGPRLEEMFVDSNTEFVIDRHQDQRDFGVELEEIADRADIELCRKPLLAMRSSCVTDLIELHPVEVVERWLDYSATPERSCCTTATVKTWRDARACVAVEPAEKA